MSLSVDVPHHPYASEFHRFSINPNAYKELNDIDNKVSSFHEDGYLIIRQLLSSDVISILRSEIDRKYNHPATTSGELDDQIRNKLALMRMFEFSNIFLQILAYKPILNLVEHILGNDCHVISQTALRTNSYCGITRWHIDGDLYFDKRFIPEGKSYMPQTPCFSLSVNIALSHFSDVKYGPTRFIPGSHRFGYKPTGENSQEVNGLHQITFDANAGDILILNHQTWHSAHQNTTDNIRYLLLTSYGKRFIQQRFYPFINYTLPQHVTHSLNEVTHRLLGGHQKGPLG
ncbi:phytanoyl-CoA dioxygenase family protein [Prochlorococcus marinus]|uniref:phytanoyl-CoA dioxygenase family protein n=1 Tax=Prochlorococcus TaxID=1218 RepID=UPI0007BBF633|nr:phytanoyl-CoA dioxygenase family protein [Prochlorococcus marinus]KZR75468.1 Phytanoyl-CoA dioxygenase (PhyH) [Prochlorococcus marinus str. MIT 1323]